MTSHLKTENFKGLINLQNAEKILRTLEQLCEYESDDIEALHICKISAMFASELHSGVLFSNKIENRLIKISENYFGKDKNIVYQKHDLSFLHIFTTCYKVGGHTRVVERWIENTNFSERHSVVLLDQGDSEIPDKLLKETGKRNGNLYNLNDYEGEIEKSRKLRNIASNYKYIVLHTHMYETIPLLAFGTNFKIPVLLYNHADHNFWLGKKVADQILSLSQSSDLLSQNFRSVSNSQIFQIPLPKPNKINKENAREKLGIHPDKKAIVSIGSPHKYTDKSPSTFIKLIEQILSKHDDIIIYIIGTNTEVKEWNDISKRSEGSVKPVGYINNDEINLYLSACDLYIESYPYGGGVALIESASYGIPVLPLDNIFTKLDSYYDLAIEINKAADTASRILNNSEGQKYLIQKRLNDFHYPESWKLHYSQTLKKLPVEHNVFKSDNPEIHTGIYGEKFFRICNAYLKNNWFNPFEISSLKFEHQLILIRILLGLTDNREKVITLFKANNWLQLNIFSELFLSEQIKIIDIYDSLNSKDKKQLPKVGALKSLIKKNTLKTTIKTFKDQLAISQVNSTLDVKVIHEESYYFNLYIEFPKSGSFEKVDWFPVENKGVALKEVKIIIKGKDGFTQNHKLDSAFINGCKNDCTQEFLFYNHSPYVSFSVNSSSKSIHISGKITTLNPYITDFKKEKKKLFKSYFKTLVNRNTNNFQKFCIYGAGKHTQWILNFIDSDKVKFIIDDEPKTEFLDGIPVRKFSSLSKANIDCILISSDTYHNEMELKLKNTFRKTHILNPYKNIEPQTDIKFY